MTLRRAARLCAVGAAWIALAAAAGCAAPNINDLSSWRGCLVQASIESRNMPHGPLTAGDPTQLIYATWNDEANEYAILRLEVPGSLPKNRGVFVGGDAESDFKVRFQRGTTLQDYDSNTVKGKVKVIEFDAQSAVIEVDLTVADPVLDLKERGSLPLKGRLELQRVPTVRSCY